MVSRAAIEIYKYALVHVNPSNTSSLQSILLIALRRILYHVNNFLSRVCRGAAIAPIL